MCQTTSGLEGHALVQAGGLKACSPWATEYIAGEFSMKKIWIAITGLAVIAGIVLLLSEGESSAPAPEDQPEEVSIPNDRVGSGIR